MSKKEQLGQRESKRLEKLGEAWAEEAGSWSYSLTNLTPADLRLMLEHFEPLQDLVRRLATGAPIAPVAAEADDADEEPRDAGKKSDRARHDALQARVRELEDELTRAYKTARQAQQRLSEIEHQNRSLQQNLAAARQEQDSLKARLDEAQEALREARSAADMERSAREKAERRAAELEKRTQHGAAGRTLAALRGNAKLARRFGLDGLGDDIDSLVRAVAVLAQRDNVVQLFEALGEEAQKRREPLTNEERALLEAAVDWYNYNWKDKRYALEEPRQGAPFDLERHRRAKHTPTGETIARVLVPGLRSGTGAPSPKPIVETE